MNKDTKKELLELIEKVKCSNDYVGLQWFTTEERYEHEKHYLPNDIEVVFMPKLEDKSTLSQFSMLIPILKEQKTVKVVFEN